MRLILGGAPLSLRLCSTICFIMCLKKLENITGLNKLFSCKFAKDESKLPKYLRFKVKKNIYLWMKNLILIEVLMSV